MKERKQANKQKNVENNRRTLVRNRKFVDNNLGMISENW